VINDSLPSFVSKFTKDQNIIDNHCLKIELETVFKRLIVPPVKKKYIGLTIVQKGKHLKEPQLYFKGSELNKKDVPFGLKEEIKKLVLDALNNESDDNVMLIKKRINMIKDKFRDIGINELLIYKEITRNFDAYKVKPQHVRSAENSNKYLGTSFSREDYKGGILYVKSTKYPDVDVLFINDKVKLNDYFKNRKKIIIFAVLRDKDYERMIEKIISISDILILTSSRSNRSLGAVKLEEAVRYKIKSLTGIRKCPDRIYSIDNVEDSIKFALKISNINDIICITGSITNLENIVK